MKTVYRKTVVALPDNITARVYFSNGRTDDIVTCLLYYSDSNIIQIPRGLLKVQ